jgi:site-specific DNA recombinase
MLSSAPDLVRFHPAKAKTYRARVGQLIRGRSDARRQEEAKEALRALVEEIVLVPVETEDGGTRLAIDLHGALASLLRLATEPRRVCRRLQLLSRMEHHEQDDE